MSLALASNPVWRLTSSSTSGSRVSGLPIVPCSSSTLPATGSTRMGTCAVWGSFVNKTNANNREGLQVCAAMPAVMPLADIYSFICKGPLVEGIGLTPERIGEEIDEWISLGLRLSRLLGFNELLLTETERTRIYHYYVPVYMWCKNELEQHRKRFEEGKPVPALVIGISAPQGCGKTTLVDALEYLFVTSGSLAASVSIDDFYLTAADQRKLAEAHKGNALLELRGNAGSHDLKLGVESIQCLRSLPDGVSGSIPHYDKSANNGRGDRSDPATWTKLQGPLEVLLFEGWMLGFKQLDNEFVKSIDPQLEIVNNNLRAYQESWYSLIDSWIVIQVEDPSWVYEWRLQAEVAMKAQGKPGMTDEQIADFVGRYMPAYKAYLQTLYTEGPPSAKPEHTLKFFIDKNRNPVG